MGFVKPEKFRNRLIFILEEISKEPVPSETADKLLSLRKQIHNSELINSPKESETPHHDGLF